jgi:hypothetical protein
MRFRGVRENTVAWVAMILAAIVAVVALAWFLFLQ